MNPRPAPRIESGNEQIRRIRAALEATAPRASTDPAERPETTCATAAAVIDLYAAGFAALDELASHMAEDRSLADRLFDALLSEASGWGDSPSSDFTYDDIVKMHDAQALDALPSILPSDLIGPADAVLRRLDPERFDTRT